MRFNFVLSAAAQAGDQLDDLRDQLTAIGHEFQVSRERIAPPPWFNLLGEGTPELTPPRLIPMMRAGYQVVALVTEQPTLATAEGMVWNYSTSEIWTQRVEYFLEMAPFFSAAWCYAPGAAKIIKRWVPRTADIEMGWGRRFDAARPAVRPAYDFCFFGGLTRRRARVIDSLIARKLSVDVIPHSANLDQRDTRIPLSKVVLDIKQHHWWDLVSSVRYVTALLANRPVVAESRSWEARHRWEDVVTFAPEDRFEDVAIMALQNWTQAATRARTALKAKPSMMREAVAILPPEREGPVEEIVVNGVPHHENGRFTPPQLIRSIRGINLVEWKDEVYVIPQMLGTVDLEGDDWKRHQSIRKFGNLITALRAVGE